MTHFNEDNTRERTVDNSDLDPLVRCDRCHYFREKKRVHFDVFRAVCHRFPSVHPAGKLAETRHDGWCGEFRAREDAK